jgi:2-polyprenyl-3-methyl-5-hydroxy-6-metoxy-1,4-benzoquinol methylase
VQRALKPEILDSLSPDDPAALHNRRDLRHINRVMRNHEWIVETLPPLLRPDDRVLEIGAGTGELAQKLAARIDPVDGLDLWPRPPDWPDGARWHQTDVCRFEHWNDYDVVIGSLIFHQFDDATLRTLGSRIAPHARVIVASEPARGRWWQWLFALLCPLIGANYVSRHDGHVSIAAGFRGDELARLLGLDPATWSWSVALTGCGAYRFVATKRT